MGDSGVPKLCFGCASRACALHTFPNIRIDYTHIGPSYNISALKTTTIPWTDTEMVSHQSINVDVAPSRVIQSVLAPLAQSAEQGPFKPKVAGSIPVRRISALRRNPAINASK